MRSAGTPARARTGRRNQWRIPRTRTRTIRAGVLVRADRLAPAASRAREARARPARARVGARKVRAVRARAARAKAARTRAAWVRAARAECRADRVAGRPAAARA